VRGFCKSRYTRACLGSSTKKRPHSTSAPERDRRRLTRRRTMTLENRYSSTAAHCSKLELDAVWSALLRCRVRELEPHLVPIANEIEGLREELRVANVARGCADAA